MAGPQQEEAAPEHPWGPPCPYLGRKRQGTEGMGGACGERVRSRHSPSMAVTSWGFQSVSIKSFPAPGPWHLLFLLPGPSFLWLLIASTFSFFRSKNDLLNTASPTHGRL